MAEKIVELRDSLAVNVARAIAAGAKPEPGTGPSLTKEAVEASITDEQYHRFPGTTVMVCCLTLANGFAVTGESACISPENYDAEMGQRYARERAVQKIWELEGYRLKSLLYPCARVEG